MKLKLTNYSPAPFLFDSNQFSWNTHTGSYHPRRRNTGFEFNCSTLANYRSRLRAQIKKTHTHGKFKNRLILDRTKKRSICYKKLENKFILSKVFFFRQRMVQDIELSLFFMKYFGISYTEATQTSNKSGKYKLIRRPAPYKTTTRTCQLTKKIPTLALSPCLNSTSNLLLRPNL